MKKITALSIALLGLVSAPFSVYSVNNDSYQKTSSSVSLSEVRTTSDSGVAESTGIQQSSDSQRTEVSQSIQESSQVSLTSQEQSTTSDESLPLEQSTPNKTSKTTTAQTSSIGYHYQELYNSYTTITEKNLMLYGNEQDAIAKRNGKEVTSYYLKTIKLATLITDEATEKVAYQVEDNRGRVIGYLAGNNWVVTPKQGQLLREDQTFLALIWHPDHVIYENFDWEVVTDENRLNRNMYQVNQSYNHFDGQTYYVLYSEGDYIGLIDKRYVTELRVTDATPSKDYREYLTVVKGPQPTYQDFLGNKKYENSQLADKTYVAKKMYTMGGNTTTYYSIYDGKDNWMGYLDSRGAEITKGPQGKYQTFNKYVTVKKNNSYNSWSNFSWKKKHNNSKLANKTYLAKGVYQHLNGKKYYSIYDSNNKWMGYINAKGVKVGKGKQGVYQPYGKYVTISRNNKYNSFSNFSWKKKIKNNKLYDRTFLAKGRYRHLNGSTYYSLYDTKGKWYGYYNSKGAKVAPGAEGIPVSTEGGYRSTNELKSSYAIWKDFSFKKKVAHKKDEHYYILAIYRHANGRTYYKIGQTDYFNHMKTVGYVNSKSMPFKAGPRPQYMEKTQSLKKVKESVWSWSGFAVFYNWDGKKWVFDYRGYWWGYNTYPSQKFTADKLKPYAIKPKYKGKSVNEWGPSSYVAYYTMK